MPESEEDSGSFDVPMSGVDFAAFLGLAKEPVSGQLTKLRKGDVIRVVNNRHIDVPDLARLSERAGF